MLLLFCELYGLVSINEGPKQSVESTNFLLTHYIRKQKGGVSVNEFLQNVNNNHEVRFRFRFRNYFFFHIFFNFYVCKIHMINLD